MNIQLIQYQKKEKNTFSHSYERENVSKHLTKTPQIPLNIISSSWDYSSDYLSYFLVFLMLELQVCSHTFTVTSFKIFPDS